MPRKYKVYITRYTYQSVALEVEVADNEHSDHAEAWGRHQLEEGKIDWDSVPMKPESPRVVAFIKY